MAPHFFETPEDFRKWLAENHSTETELLVGFQKKNTGKPSITWPESVDQALCFGWIDGVRRSIDENSYSIRFTPRKPNSIWSNVNIRKANELLEKGLMQPAGIAAFSKRTDAKSGIYSFEKEAECLLPEYEKLFRKNKAAWTFFNTQPPGYRKLSIHHVMAAKQETTRLKRLEQLITASAGLKRL